MQQNNICIATISWARNEAEEELLRSSLQQLAKLQLQVFITDGGSPDSFTSFINNLPNFHLLKAEAKGVYAQARHSLQKAYQSGAEFILYTEPDKESFFQKDLQALLEAAEKNVNTGIFMASRSAEGLATFPSFQQMTERTINQCCAEVIGKEYDYTYGPFLLNRKLVPYLEKVKEDIGWGWRPYLFSIAHRLGLEVAATTQSFECPPDQREDDPKERIYRMRQLEQNIRGIVLSTMVDL